MWTVSPPLIRFQTFPNHTSRLKTVSYHTVVIFDTVTLTKPQRFNAVTFTVTFKNAVTMHMEFL